MELLFVILFVLLAAGVGYFFLLRWGREKVQSETRNLSGELRAYENHYRQFLSGQQVHSPQDPEPYGTLARTLKDSADQAGQQLYALRERYVRIQERLPRRAASPFSALAVSPFLLLDLKKELGGVRQGLAQEQANLSQIAQQAQAMEALGWQEALRARQATAAEAQLQQRLQALQTRRAHGPAFDALTRQAQQADELLSQIPEYFLTADQTAISVQADKAMVIRVHQSLEAARPLHDQIAQQLEEWEKRLSRLDEKLSRQRQNLGNLEQSLATLPTALDSSAFQRQFVELQTEAQKLQIQSSRPELEKAPGIEASVDRQLTAFQELDAQVRTARQGQATLEHLLLELGQDLKEISSRYATLGAAKSFRVLWSQTSNSLANLSQQVNELGPVDRKRTPEKLEQDLATANQLALKQRELAVYVQQIENQQGELAALLEGPELSQAVLWAQSTGKLLQQVREYHPENWPRADGVNSLPDDLRSLTDSLQRLGAGRPGEGIAETQFAPRLAEAQRVGQQYQSLRARVSMVEARLVELQQNETQARDTLEDTRKNLAQVAFIINSNPTLTKIAGGEVGRFQAQLDKQYQELDQRQQGAVDSKARQAAGISARIEQGLNEWLDQLNLDIQARVKSLTVSLTRLDSIAPLEDAPVAEARRLLSGGQIYGSSAHGQKTHLPLEALVLEYKRRSEFAQTCSAVQMALQDIEKPVVDTYATANQGRQQVQDQFNAANNWLRQTRAWPPVAVDVDAEYKALGKVEADWAGIREQPVKAIDLVQRLGELARAYQSLADRMRQLIERGNREQNEVQTLEAELDENLHLWEKLQKSYQDNPEASEDIQGLLNEADQEMYRVKMQYKEGTLTYAQALQAIQTMHRKVRLYQAALDETHVVDVNGRVIASRESKRAPGEW